jgi:hypothetical protein
MIDLRRHSTEPEFMDVESSRVPLGTGRILVTLTDHAGTTLASSNLTAWSQSAGLTSGVGPACSR